MDNLASNDIASEAKTKNALSGTGQKISLAIGRAIGDYNLIEDGDRILVAVSGGKDSLTLLKLLQERRSWAPVRFEVIAAHVKTDFACASCIHEDLLTGFFREIGVESVFASVQVLDEQKKTNCFWCSWNRRRALFDLAEKKGCNKIAFGHHKDDIIETILMNLFFKGEISCMQPRQEMFEGKVVMIRPLCYVEEDLTRRFAEEQGFPAKLCRCPFGKDSQRQKMKALIRDLAGATPGTSIKSNIFNSVARVNRDYIGLKPEE